MGVLDIILIVALVLALVVGGLYLLNKWAYKKLNTQQEMIDKAKQLTSIYVIDKKRDKVTNVNLPKMVVSQMPRAYKLMKMHFVQAKIGPQIMTLICDKKVFNAIPVKKNIKVELAGIYIVNMLGMKSDKELKEIKKAKKDKEKSEKKSKK